jgi:hypothetical protein
MWEPVELLLTMYKNTTALISDAQVLQLQLITGYVLLWCNVSSVGRAICCRVQITSRSPICGGPPPHNNNCPYEG